MKLINCNELRLIEEYGRPRAMWEAKDPSFMRGLQERGYQTYPMDFPATITEEFYELLKEAKVFGLFHDELVHGWPSLVALAPYDVVPNYFKTPVERSYDN